MPDTRLTISPSSIDEARRFPVEWRSDNPPPLPGVFAVAVTNPAGTAVGVGIAGRPDCRELDDGTTVEVAQNCTVGEPNAPSIVFDALCLAAEALGYRRAVAYTMPDESRVWMRASCWRFVEEADAKSGASVCWQRDL